MVTSVVVGASRRRLRVASSVVPYLLVLPAVLLVAAVLVYPMVRAGWMSFLDWPFASPEQAEFVGLDNYRSLWGSSQFWTSLRFTGLFTVVAIVIEFALALAGALLLDGLRRGRGVMMSLAVAPYMVAPIAVGLIWRLMLQRDIGIVNHVTGLFGIPRVSWLSDAVPAFFATVTAESWMQMPFVMLILLAGLTAIPDDLMEAARMDGASPLKVVTHLKLPLLAPYIAIALTFETIFKLRVFDLVLTLTRGGPGGGTTPLGLLIQRFFFRYFEGGTAAAASVVLLVIGGVVALGYLRLIYREIEY